MRTLKELYGVVIEEVERSARWGICKCIISLDVDGTVTHNEFKMLEDHFDSIPRPTAESHPHLDKYLTPECPYYFTVGLKEPRIAFLKEIQNSLP